MNVAALSAENARLKALLAQTQAALAEHQAALAEVEEARRRLEVIVGELRRDTFGARSEKLSAEQHNLPLEGVEIAQGILDAAQEKAEAAIKGKSAGGASARNRNRGQLPAHLPRVERVIEPDNILCPCGCGEMTRIGEDVAERLDLIPAQFARARHPAAEIRLRALLGGGCTGACARASGAGRLAEGGADRPNHCRQVR